MILSFWMLLLLSNCRNLFGFSLAAFGCRHRIPRVPSQRFEFVRHPTICCQWAASMGNETESKTKDGVSWLLGKDGSYRLAYQNVPATDEDEGMDSPPAVLFCNGFRSVMTDGTKVVALQDYCGKRGWEFCTFDYRGHGLSSGTFEECTLTDWIADASEILDRVLLEHHKRVVLVGSSMGAWIAIHLALQYNKNRKSSHNRKDDISIVGILGIASAPDFFQDLYASSTEEEKEEWRTQGMLNLPSRYGDPYPFSWNLIQDAAEHWGILPKSISFSSSSSSSSTTNQLDLGCPVRLLHGKCDEDISWTKSRELTELLNKNSKNKNAILSLIEDGDHRLSRSQDIQLLLDTLDDLMENIQDEL